MIEKAEVSNLCFFCYLYKLYEELPHLFIINKTTKEINCL